MPSMTFPKTTCLPFRCGVPVLAVMMKNWEPFVFGLVISVRAFVTGKMIMMSYPLFWVVLVVVMGDGEGVETGDVPP